MGEILGQGKPKKKKGKILLLVKKNWNWEFHALTLPAFNFVLCSQGPLLIKAIESKKNRGFI